MWSSVAHAAAQQPQGSSPQDALVSTLFLIVPMILIFYFLLIRPQTKQAKQHREFLAGLKRGDKVITASGIYGKIVQIADEFVILEIADKVRIKMAKSQISGYQPEQDKESSD